MYGTELRKTVKLTSTQRSRLSRKRKKLKIQIQKLNITPAYISFCAMPTDVSRRVTLLKITTKFLDLKNQEIADVDRDTKEISALAKNGFDSMPKKWKQTYLRLQFYATCDLQKLHQPRVQTLLNHMATKRQAMRTGDSLCGWFNIILPTVANELLQASIVCEKGPLAKICPVCGKAWWMISRPNKKSCSTKCANHKSNTWRHFFKSQWNDLYKTDYRK